MIRSQHRDSVRARQAKKRRLAREAAVKLERLERREFMAADIAAALAGLPDPLAPSVTNASTAITLNTRVGMPASSLAAAPRTAENSGEGEASNSSAPYGTLRFDFGTDTSTVAPDFIQVSDTMRYSPQRGFGWLAAVNAVDRGMADDERRDFNAGQDITFAVDVPDGVYVIELTLGDRRQMRDRVEVYVNGGLRDTITTLGGEFATPQYTATVNNGQISIRLVDRGGESDFAAIAALEITAIDPEAGLPEDVPQDEHDPSPLLVIQVHGFTSPPKSNNFIGEKLGEFVSDIIKETMDKYPMAGDIVGDAVGSAVENAIGNLSPPPPRPPVTPWVYESARAIAKATRREQLGNFSGDVRPIALPKIERAATEQDLLALQKGSKTFIALDWTLESSAGTPEGVLEALTNTYKENLHRESVTRAANGLYRMVEARVNEKLRRDPGTKVDLLIIGHSYGTNVNRELVTLLNRSGLIDKVDFVKVVELDPVAMNPDDNLSERADSHDRYFWRHPEMARGGRPVVDSVVNYFQRDGLAITNVLEADLTMGKPLDDQLGGGPFGFFNNWVRVYDPVSGTELDRFRNRDPESGKISLGQVRDIAYSPDGRWIATAGEDRSIRVRDAATHAETRLIQTARQDVTDMEFFPDGSALATVGRDGRVRVFSTETGAELWKGEHHGAIGAATGYVGATRLAISADGRILATAGTGKSIKLWQRQAGSWSFTPLQTLPGHAGGTTALDFHPDGTLVTGGGDSLARIWQVAGSGYALRQTLTMAGPVRRSVFNPQGTTLALAAGREASLWMRGGDGQWLRVRTFTDHVGDVQAVTFNSAGTVLATGGEDKTIFLYDAATGRKLNTLNQAMLPVKNLAFSPDGQRLAAVSIDMRGGPVNDIDVTENARSRIGVIEYLASGGSKRHTDVPFIYIDEVIEKGNDPFFENRDKPRASRFGDFVPVDDGPGVADSTDWQVDDADSLAATVDVARNLRPPVIARPVGSRTITDTVAIDIDAVFSDPDSNPLTITARSSNPAALQVTLNGGRLTLRPLEEATVDVELTAHDGLWATQQRFQVTADGAYWRGVADRLRTETQTAARQLAEAGDHADRAEVAIDRASRIAAEASAALERLNPRQADLRSSLNNAQRRATQAQADFTAATQERDSVQAAYNRAESTRASARNEFDRIDGSTRQARQAFDQAVDRRQAAWQRLQSASNRERPQRQSEWQSARDAAAAAESRWNDWQRQRAAAEQTLNSARDQRDAFERQLNAANRRVDNLAGPRRTANEELAVAQQRWNAWERDVAAERTRLANAQADTNLARDQWNQANTKSRTAATTLDSVSRQLNDARQNKWVQRIGLEQLENGPLADAQRRRAGQAPRLEQLGIRITRTQERITAALGQ